MAGKKNDDKRRPRKGKKVTVTREVIEGDIKKITKTTRTTEPAGPTRVTTDLKRAGDGDQAPDAEGLDDEEDFFLNKCIASAVNGHVWVAHPCIKVTEAGGIYFNEQAFLRFGLRPGMRFLLSMTTSKREIRLRLVKKEFKHRTTAHREGTYRLTDKTAYARRCDCPMGALVSHSKHGITLVARHPGLRGHVFRLRQHPEDLNVLVVRTDEGVSVKASIEDKLTMRSRATVPLPFHPELAW